MSELDDKAKKWAGDAFERNLEPIMNSEIFACMFSGGREDALQCLQLGMAIMMDKPILVLAREGVKVPKNLARVAVRVAEADYNNPEAIARLIKELTEGE